MEVGGGVEPVDQYAAPLAEGVIDPGRGLHEVRGQVLAQCVVNANQLVNKVLYRIRGGGGAQPTLGKGGCPSMS